MGTKHALPTTIRTQPTPSTPPQVLAIPLQTNMSTSTTVFDHAPDASKEGTSMEVPNASGSSASSHSVVTDHVVGLTLFDSIEGDADVSIDVPGTSNRNRVSQEDDDALLYGTSRRRRTAGHAPHHRRSSTGSKSVLSAFVTALGEYRTVVDTPSTADANVPAYPSDARAGWAIRNKRRKWSKRDIDAIWTKTRGHCYYCGAFLTQKSPRVTFWEIDHLRPWKLTKSAEDHVGNAVAACVTCNKIKGTKSVLEFFESYIKQPVRCQRISLTDGTMCLQPCGADVAANTDAKSSGVTAVTTTTTITASASVTTVGALKRETDAAGKATPPVRTVYDRRSYMSSYCDLHRAPCPSIPIVIATPIAVPLDASAPSAPLTTVTAVVSKFLSTW